jgi:uncharacterized membrane protein
MKVYSKKIAAIVLFVVLTMSLSSMAVVALSPSTPSAPAAVVGAAYWTSDTVYVPGNNGSNTTTNNNVKQEAGLTASFKATSKSPNNNVDARLINSNNESRSAWARNLPVNVVVHAAETSDTTIGYQYRAEVSTDLLSPAVTVGLDFSADNL